MPDLFHEIVSFCIAVNEGSLEISSFLVFFFELILNGIHYFNVLDAAKVKELYELVHEPQFHMYGFEDFPIFGGIRFEPLNFHFAFGEMESQRLPKFLDVNFREFKFVDVLELFWQEKTTPGRKHRFRFG